MVFVKKQKKEASVDLTIAASRGMRIKKGQVGIEVEVESDRSGSLPKEPTVATYWMYHRDSSLRGADNGEYVLSKPINFDKVDEALDLLWTRFRECGSRLSESNRTSIHVHLNVLPFFHNRLVSLMALWFIHEDVLSHWCGEHRVGNLFCIQAKNGQAILTQLKKWIEMKGMYDLDEDAMHYAAFNAAAIQTLGSVEIRTLRGATEPETIKQWVRILKCLYDRSETFTDPREIVENFSMQGPLDFFRTTFGEEAETIVSGIDLNEDQIRTSLYEGVRNAQDLVFARDWSDFNPTSVLEDPFGRKTKTTSEEVQVVFDPQLAGADQMMWAVGALPVGMRGDVRNRPRTPPQPARHRFAPFPPEVRET